MKHLLYTLAIASGSLLALNANAKVGDLLPRPHQIELTAGAAPFALQRTVAITDPTGCTYLKNFFTANRRGRERCRHSHRHPGQCH